MNPIEQTRIHMSEHSYPTPTRNHLSMHNREASKRRMYGATRAGEIRFGKVAADGTHVMAPTASEQTRIRMEELANIRMDAALRMADIRERLNKSVVHADSWARKV
jgi:hypothetical protein